MSKKNENPENKIKYDAEYIAYVEHGESAAVFITRDIVRSIKTNGKWVDVLSVDGLQNDDNQWDFNSFKVELFPRKTNPIYPVDASDEWKKYLTWKTAHADIENLREKGYIGSKFEIFPKLVNTNKGKFETVQGVWDKKSKSFIPKLFLMSGELKYTNLFELRETKIPAEPNWDYHILKIKRL